MVVLPHCEDKKNSDDVQLSLSSQTTPYRSLERSSKPEQVKLEESPEPETCLSLQQPSGLSSIACTERKSEVQSLNEEQGKYQKYSPASEIQPEIKEHCFIHVSSFQSSPIHVERHDHVQATLPENSTPSLAGRDGAITLENIGLSVGKSLEQNQPCFSDSNFKSSSKCSDIHLSLNLRQSFPNQNLSPDANYPGHKYNRQGRSFNPVHCIQQQRYHPYLLNNQNIVVPEHNGLSLCLDATKFSGNTYDSPLLGTDDGNSRSYPAAMATHNEVIGDRALFNKAFQQFNEKLGLPVRPPKIGDGDLDLFKLYKEVTTRGGLQVAMNNRKWEEVTVICGLHMSAMYFLRHVYSCMLHHFEQVYFFRASCRVTSVPENINMEAEDKSDMNKQNKFINGNANSSQGSGVRIPITGEIDGKFEYGYLVTVNVGARQMRGILYHVDPGNVVTENATQNVDLAELKPVDLPASLGRKRQRTQVFKKDPNAPRQNRTGYNFFFAEQRVRLKTTQPDKDRAISKTIGNLWNKLSEDEKIPYQIMGLKDKERYLKEMKEYKEKFKSISDASSKDSVHTSKTVRRPLKCISEPDDDSQNIMLPVPNNSQADTQSSLNSPVDGLTESSQLVYRAQEPLTSTVSISSVDSEDAGKCNYPTNSGTAPPGKLTTVESSDGHDSEFSNTSGQ